MRSVIEENWGLVRLERGEEVFSELEKLALEYQWSSVHVSGIGALEAIELGAYELDKKEYIRKVFPDIYELLSLEGNLSWPEGKPFFHLHATLSDHSFQCFGGHLFKATVAVTCELHLRPFQTEGLHIDRQLDDSVGLKLLNFCPVGRPDPR